MTYKFLKGFIWWIKRVSLFLRRSLYKEKELTAQTAIGREQDKSIYKPIQSPTEFSLLKTQTIENSEKQALTKTIQRSSGDQVPMARPPKESKAILPEEMGKQEPRSCSGSSEVEPEHTPERSRREIENQTPIAIKSLPSKPKPERESTLKEDEVTVGIKKPYKKAPPTEKGKSKVKNLNKPQKETAPRRAREEIDLGHIRREKPKTNKARRQSSADKVTVKTSEGQKVGTRVRFPFVELSLDEGKVFLVLPAQELRSTRLVPGIHNINYIVKLNGKEQKITSRANVNEQGLVKVEEERIELQSSLQSFQVAHPDELGGGRYRYKHSNTNLYVFLAIGNNKGRMHYLYDDMSSNTNSIPKRDAWVLLNDDCELGSEPDIIEERWIWGRYQPLLIDLKQATELVVRSGQTNQKQEIPCDPSFTLEGKNLVEDDFTNEMPLFSGETVRIRAPTRTQNPAGWTLWIQNKHAGHRIINEKWSGTEPIELKLPDMLPCQLGEFQIDVCEQGQSVATETLFFRYIPFLSLSYPRELVIPHPREGHKAATIGVHLGQLFANCELKTLQKKCPEAKGYKIELPPVEDTLLFRIGRKGEPETWLNVKITVPRLKWKTSKHLEWADKPIKLNRSGLVSGSELCLSIRTNDYHNKYDISAFLETEHKKLQEARLLRKGAVYVLKLNQFYDTIRKTENNIRIRLNIRNMENGQEIETVACIYFPKTGNEKDESLPTSGNSAVTAIKKLSVKTHERKCRRLVRPMVKKGCGYTSMRGGKGFSKQEINEAGINSMDVRWLSLAFDKRRKSVHPQNVHALKCLKLEVKKNADRSS